jgi:acetyl-CoA carboxylase biotin carboxyl carrier protein
MSHYCYDFRDRAIIRASVPVPRRRLQGPGKRPLVAHDNLTYDDLLRIVELVKSSEQFTEFRLKVGDIEVELRRGAPAAGVRSSAAARSTPGAEDFPPVAPAAPEPARGAPAWPADSVVVCSPMVGTFYRAPQPGAPPFIEVGQVVEPENVVCIIEVMKLMNSIRAGAQGTVRHILVDDAAAVEAGQPLIVLAPSG